MGILLYNHTISIDAQLSRKYSIADALFSVTQQRVLSVLFSNTENSYHLNEIVRAANGGTGGIQRELKKLETSGLVNSWRIGNQKHYQANSDSPVFADLKNIVGKTFGLRQPLLSALEPLIENINLAFIYGSVAKSTDTSSSDIDLLVVSELNPDDLYQVLLPVENRLKRKINITLYTEDEYTSRLSSKRGFLKKILALPVVELVGEISK